MTNAPILDGDGLHRTLRRLAHEIVEAQGVEGIVLVGIESGGAVIAKRLAGEIEQFEGQRPALGVWLNRLAGLVMIGFGLRMVWIR